MKFEEIMIDHLNIDSTTIEIDTEMGQLQIEKYGFTSSKCKKRRNVFKFYI